jgi:hypothetical protein
MQKLSELLKQKYQNSKEDIVLDGADFISQKGYTLIPNYVLHSRGLSAFAKLVYSVILSYAWGSKNSSFPGQERLAEDCGLGIATVKRTIKELKEKEFITVIQRGQGKTNVYVLHFMKK